MEVHGLRVAFFVRDSSENTLVSIMLKSGFGRKYSVASGGNEGMSFSSGMTGAELKLEDSNGRIAFSKRKFLSFR